jgi:hypothetical protein
MGRPQSWSGGGEPPLQKADLRPFSRKGRNRWVRSLALTVTMQLKPRVDTMAVLIRVNSYLFVVKLNYYRPRFELEHHLSEVIQ